jgi:hypothetical protein
MHQQHKNEASSASGLRSSSGDSADGQKVQAAVLDAGSSTLAQRSSIVDNRPRTAGRPGSPSTASASPSPPPRRPRKRPLKRRHLLSALARRFIDIEAGVAGYASADEDEDEEADDGSDHSSAVSEEIENSTEGESESGAE